MPIPPQLVEPLSVAVARAFTPYDLELVMLKATGDPLYEVWVAPGQPTRRMAFQLLQEVDRAGVTPLVLADMLARRPQAADLRALVGQASPEALAMAPKGEMTLSAQQAGQPLPGAGDDAFAPGLQKNVRPNLTKLDLLAWVDRLMRVKDRVCRIETATGALGTGFLVGPSAVLTNWHVVEKLADRPADLRCRFDYAMQPDGSRRAGAVVAAEALLAHAPCSPAELTADPDQPPPTPDQLDYALLSLAEPAGEQGLDGHSRGWLALPEGGFPLAAGAPLLIVQHPDGAPMKLAMDTEAVIGPVADGLRVRYRTNTDNGSSGSPCFSMDWDPVALHHYGDPAWGAPRFNQGVPLGLIRAAILAAGQSAALEG